MPQALPVAFMNAAALFSGSGAVLVGAYAAGQIAATVIPLAVSVGVQAWQAQKMKKQLAAINDTQGVQAILKQAIPPQRLILGRATVGGALFFYEAKPPYLWIGILLASHECDGLDALSIRGLRVFIDSDGFATSVPFADGSDKYIEVSFRPGTMDQAIDPIIARDFPTIPSKFRQRGHATLVVKAHYGFGATRDDKDDDHKEVYGDSGQFVPLPVVRGAKMYDPRRAGCVIDDPSTWVWSDNAALATMRYLTHKWPDMQLVDPVRVDWDRVAACADDCDRWMPVADGSAIRLSTVDGVIQSVDPVFDVIENLKTAFFGHIVLDRGKVYPLARAARPAESTLHMDMLRGPVSYVAEPRLSETVNVVSTTFVAEDRDGQTVAGPVLRDATQIAADGAAREQAIPGAFIKDARRIQMKAKAFRDLARAARKIACGATIEAMDWTIGQTVNVSLTGVFAYMNGSYELTEKAWDDKLGGLRLVLSGTVATAFDFDPATDEQPFTLDDDTLDAEAA